jgi:hypothetical protein
VLKIFSMSNRENWVIDGYPGNLGPEEYNPSENSKWLYYMTKSDLPNIEIEQKMIVNGVIDMFVDQKGDIGENYFSSMMKPINASEEWMETYNMLNVIDSIFSGGSYEVKVSYPSGVLVGLKVIDIKVTLEKDDLRGELTAAGFYRRFRGNVVEMLSHEAKIRRGDKGYSLDPSGVHQHRPEYSHFRPGLNIDTEMVLNYIKTGLDI